MVAALGLVVSFRAVLTTTLVDFTTTRLGVAYKHLRFPHGADFTLSANRRYQLGACPLVCEHTVLTGSFATDALGTSSLVFRVGSVTRFEVTVAAVTGANLALVPLIVLVRVDAAFPCYPRGGTAAIGRQVELLRAIDAVGSASSLVLVSSGLADFASCLLIRLLVRARAANLARRLLVLILVFPGFALDGIDVFAERAIPPGRACFAAGGVVAVLVLSGPANFAALAVSLLVLAFIALDAFVPITAGVPVPRGELSSRACFFGGRERRGMHYYYILFCCLLLLLLLLCMYRGGGGGGGG